MDRGTGAGGFQGSKDATGGVDHPRTQRSAMINAVFVQWREEKEEREDCRREGVEDLEVCGPMDEIGSGGEVTEGVLDGPGG